MTAVHTSAAELLTFPTLRPKSWEWLEVVSQRSTLKSSSSRYVRQGRDDRIPSRRIRTDPFSISTDVISIKPGYVVRHRVFESGPRQLDPRHASIRRRGQGFVSWFKKAEAYASAATPAHFSPSAQRGPQTPSGSGLFTRNKFVCTPGWLQAASRSLRTFSSTIRKSALGARQVVR